MKELILIRGMSGSGKTTLAHLMANITNSHRIYSTDDYFMVDNHYEFDASQLKKAHQWNQDRTLKAMMDGWELVIVPNTFTTVWEMQPYIDMAKAMGYKLTVIRVESGLTPQQLMERNVHNVPYDAILRQWDRTEDY